MSMNYYVCLIDSEWLGESYDRGEIVTAEPGTGPPGVAWANFDPPGELSGTPKLTFVEDNGSGDLVFKYELEETDMHFIIKAMVGIPTATPILVKGKRSPARDPARPEEAGKPQLRFGEGAATTSSRSYVGWAPGGSRPEPKPRKEKDLLRSGFDEDLLRKGL